MVDYPVRNPLVVRNGVVATSHPLASQAGLWALRSGGNAIDAAVTAAAVLTVVEPMNSHVGGDLFLLFRDAKTGAVRALNGSGAAPARAELSAFPGGRIPDRGWLAVEIPGVVDAWATALEQFGTFSPARALEPAIEYATNGFAISRQVVDAIAANTAILRRDEWAGRQFLPDGRVPAPGQALRQPGLGRTLKLIAEGGRDAFYEGPIAQAIVKACRAGGGLISAEDLARHRSELLDPIRVDYRGYTVHGQPPVSQGHILLESLAILDGFDLRSLGLLSAEAIHLQVEAKRIAFADREALAGDPRVTGFDVSRLLDPRFAAERRSRISRDRAMSAVPPVPAGVGPDTTYLLTADRDGNLVSFIQSVFQAFGAGVVAGETGVVMNNRMFGFSSRPDHPNVVAPGKRTVHTLNTYLVTHGDRPLLVGGTPGAHHQVQVNLQIISDMIDFGLDVVEASDAPRWVHSDEAGIEIESRVSADVLSRLEAMGHRVVPLGPWLGAGRVQLLRVDAETGAYFAIGDARTDGGVVGW